MATGRAKVVCMECGKKFTVSVKAGSCPECPKCGGVDIESREPDTKGMGIG